MAKGVEDTAFYRYGRLLSLNEVGGDPGTFGRGVDAYHEHCRHLAESWPASMLTSSTHDTQRSADVRARLPLLSELPSAWADALQRCPARNDTHHRAAGPHSQTPLPPYSHLLRPIPLHATPPRQRHRTRQ